MVPSPSNGPIFNIVGLMLYIIPVQRRRTQNVATYLLGAGFPIHSPIYFH